MERSQVEFQLFSVIKDIGKDDLWVFITVPRSFMILLLLLDLSITIVIIFAGYLFDCACYCFSRIRVSSCWILLFV